MKPLILLTPSFTFRENASPNDFTYRVNSHYLSCLGAAGALPVMVGDTDPEALAERADGILFTGGEDLDPAFFGEEKVNSTVTVTPARDSLEFRLFAAAKAKGIPMIGICRGIQLLNVALGGSLWQDIPSQCPQSVPHANGAVHTVQTAENSLFRSLFGAEFSTNSYHHQSVKAPGEGLRVTAQTSDGIIEAVEHQSLPIWATQWHPERMCADFRPAELPPQERFFEFFVRQCAERMR